MILSVLSVLILCCIIALCVAVVFWVLNAIGVGPPERVERIIWLIAALICLYLVIRTLAPMIP